MKTLTTLAIMSVAGGLLLTSAPVHAQFGGGAGAGGYGGGLADEGAGAGFYGGGMAAGAFVPQYWVMDATQFIDNGLNTANVLRREMGSRIQAPRILGRQATRLVDTVARAQDDLRGLEQNALATNPRAFPALRDAMAQLVAARSEADRLAAIANRGDIGPAYIATVESAVSHLLGAKRMIAQVEQAYRGTGGAGINAGVGKGVGGYGGAGMGAYGRGTDRAGIYSLGGDDAAAAGTAYTNGLLEAYGGGPSPYLGHYGPNGIGTGAIEGYGGGPGAAGGGAGADAGGVPGGPR